MAATGRKNRELIQKSQEQLKKGNNTGIESLRLQCLARGANGIKGLGRTFRIMDDDSNKCLDIAEFKKGIHDYGLDMTKDEVQKIFCDLDKDGSGSVDFDEFLIALRPPMSQGRRGIINKAFRKLDKTGDSRLTVEDLKGVYNVKKHPKYLNGEWTEDQCLKTFLDSFDSDDKDGVIMESEFMNYYSGVSASIDNDAYFDLMMRNAYKI